MTGVKSRKLLLRWFTCHAVAWMFSVLHRIRCSCTPSTTTGEAHEENRNVLVESAGRGNVKALSELSATNFDFLIIPGVLVQRRTCLPEKNWAMDGVEGVVDDLLSAVNAFHQNGKPIGACCIAQSFGKVNTWREVDCWVVVLGRKVALR